MTVVDKLRGGKVGNGRYGKEWVRMERDGKGWERNRKGWEGMERDGNGLVVTTVEYKVYSWSSSDHCEVQGIFLV